MDELLTEEGYKDKLRKLSADLSARANELLWEQPERMKRMKAMNPDFFDKFWEKHDNLDKMCALYLEGEIPWDSELIETTETIPASSSNQAVTFKTKKFDTTHSVMDKARDLLVFLSTEVEKIK